MDKHERVADEIVGYISGGEIGTGSISELAFAGKQLAAILRREYGDDEYIHKEIARVATLEALEEAEAECTRNADDFQREATRCTSAATRDIYMAVERAHRADAAAIRALKTKEPA